MNSPGNPRCSTLFLWLARLALSLVFLVNLQCALAFLFSPDRYVGSFEVSGVGGRVLIQGLGIFILLWIVPYPAAIYHPRRHILSFAYTLVAQAIGTLAETILLLTLPSGHPALRAAGLRFILVDGIGLLLLLATFLLVWHKVAPRPIQHYNRQPDNPLSH